MKNIFTKLNHSTVSALMLMQVVLGLTACQMTVNSISSNNSTSQDSTGLQGVGIKNYEQIFASMVAATGIDPNSNNGNMTVYYNNNKASLPESNDIESLQANQLIAIMNMAGQFCNEILNTVNANNVSINRQNFFAGTEFGSPDATFNSKKISDLLGTNAQKTALAEFILNKIWGEEIAPSQNRQDAISTLVSLSTELSTGYGDNNSNLKRVIAGVCAAALGSGPVIYF